MNQPEHHLPKSPAPPVPAVRSILAALMLAILKSWLSSNVLRLLGWSVAALSVLTVLFGARQAGRNAERNDQLKKIVEVKDAQLRATLDAPRTRGELVDRLRRGKF